MRRLTLVALACLVPTLASAQVSRPNPSPTPKPDPVVGYALPQPSAKPPCLNAQAYLVADPTGCVYTCSDGSFVILGGATCAFPTTAATASPAPTATSTPNNQP